MSKTTDIELINGCIDNDRAAQELLYRTYFGKMYGMCLRHSGEQTIAMTIVNDGFLKVFKNIAKFKHKGSFEGWIRRIMYNTVCDYYRKQSNKQKYIEIDDKGIDAGVYHQLDYEDLLLLVNNLTPATKQVFILYAIEGYKHHEIAEHIDISISTSKWHLANARTKLQAMIKTKDKGLRII